jgi:hypothetical protein
MTLNAPTQMLFIIAVVVAIVAVLGYFISIPVISTYAFWIMTVAFIVLAAACMFKGA